MAVRGSVHLWLVDALAAAVITATHVVMAFDQVNYHGPRWFGLVLAAAIGLPIAVRRRWPLAVWAVVLVASGVSTVADLMLEPYSGLAFALYLVALATPANRAVPALVLSLVVPLVTLPVQAGFAPDMNLTDSMGLTVVVWLVLGAVWTAGVALRKQRAGLARERERQAQQALADERLRIARELHDVVAHSMSVISVKAAVANHVAETRPEEARDALAVIERTSRQALTELRTMLGVLRSSVDGAELTPAVGGLAALAEQAESAGVRVSLTESGVAGLPDGIMLAVYRIVQEALTNVVRHAAPARCSVRVDADAEEVRIDVVDDGPGTLPGPGTGHGLIGMRERVAVYGGEFDAGARPGGGFAVRAVLPYRKD